MSDIRLLREKLRTIHKELYLSVEKTRNGLAEVEKELYEVMLKIDSTLENLEDKDG
jgi:hypothetical protein